MHVLECASALTVVNPHLFLSVSISWSLVIKVFQVATLNKNIKKNRNHIIMSKMIYNLLLATSKLFLPFCIVLFEVFSLEQQEVEFGQPQKMKNWWSRQELWLVIF